MKSLKIYMIYTFCIAIALTAAAESVISNVVVNQRWPWSEKVDVDFILSGDTSDVEVTATWDTHPAPYRLGTLFGCVPGQRRFTWDPAKSDFKGQTLTGFTVALSNVSVEAHKYIVVDLVDGGYEFLSDVPAGGWTAAHKSSKMVFRRISAGTYTLGEDQATYEHLEHANPPYYATIQNRREVTFTSDFYVGIFKYTKAQHASLGCEVTGDADDKPHDGLSYNDLRGEKPAINWPNTEYRVSEDSIVAKLRAKAGLVVDLCEEEQWEVAARANTETFWPTGGNTNETFSTHTNQVDEFVAWYGNSTGTVLQRKQQKPVGKKAHNGWGLYDVVGLAGELTLDAAPGERNIPTTGRSYLSIDPVGDENCAKRVIRSASGNGENTQLCELLPCRRQLADPSAASYSTRFCIHLKPLGSLTFEGL